MRNLDAIRMFYLCLIQYRIVRPRSFCRIFICMQRTYLAIANTGYTVNGLGKIIPGADSFITEMIDTGNNPPVDSRKNGTCQIIGICRCAYTGRRQPPASLAHVPDEASSSQNYPVNGIEPCCTDNHGTAAMLHHRLLTRQFGKNHILNWDK